MKKMICAAAIIMLCVLMGGCRLPDDTKAGRFVPDDAESALSGVTPEQRAEIKNLYGCYWRTEKNSCTEIGDQGLILYSYAMSFHYTNLKWKYSVSEWECTAFARNDRDYVDENKKVVLKFVKKTDGSIELSQHVIPMDQKLGSFTKGKTIEKIEKDGEIFYVYDKNNYSGTDMKLKVPEPR